MAEAEAAIQALLPEPVPDADAPSSARPVAAPATLSLADRFSTLLDVGRHIASAPSPAAVFAAVRQAAATLLRVERVLVLDVDHDVDASGSSSSIDGWSRSLVGQALASGRPVVISDAAAADPADSVVLSGLRSALCAPISSEGRPVACLYVTHSQVADLFGEDEIQLIEFVTVLAGPPWSTWPAPRPASGRWPRTRATSSRSSTATSGSSTRARP